MTSCDIAALYQICLQAHSRSSQMTCTWNKNVLFVSTLNIYPCLFVQTILWIWYVSILIATILRMTLAKKKRTAPFFLSSYSKVRSNYIEAWQISALRVYLKTKIIRLQVILRITTRYRIHLPFFFTKKWQKKYQKKSAAFINLIFTAIHGFRSFH